MSVLKVNPIVGQSKSQIKKVAAIIATDIEEAAKNAGDLGFDTTRIVYHSRNELKQEERMASGNYIPRKGQMSDAVKAVLDSQVKKILKIKYDIGKKELGMLDRTSPFKIELLSERRCLESYDHVTNEYYSLSSTAGLVINPRKGSGLPLTVVSSPESYLNKSDSEFFAFCVKKAVDMVNVYKKAVNDFSSHKINKELHNETTELERPVKTKLKDFKAAYVRCDLKSIKRLSNFFENLAQKKLQLDDKFRADKEIALQKLKETVIEAWEKIQQEKFVAQTPAERARSKARAKALTTARKYEREHKLNNQTN